MNITEKLLTSHLVFGELIPGAEIALRIDHTLTQDSTGTMAYLQFEAMGVDQVKTMGSVAFVDHNMLQTGPENADDHAYIRSVAAAHGIRYSRPGNGICHQVFLERFGIPGRTLLGSDSHTTTGGGIGMLAMGAGGLDVAVAMAGGAYYIPCPKVIEVRLEGCLRPFVSAKDVILEVLRRLSVKGGVGRVIEYTGAGLAQLSVPERATIANMGTELGATTSVFPSDEVTREFLRAQKREEDWVPISADADAEYDETLIIDLSALVPLAAEPHSPDAVRTVEEIGEIQVNQVCIGSCTNSSYMDMMKVAAILKGKTVHPGVSLTISPGSKQVLTMLARNGALADMIEAGARILESGCGPCIGMGQAPETDAVSVRTFNRNFYARSGTKSAMVYLVSPETAAATAIMGRLTDPRKLTPISVIPQPDSYPTDDNMILLPTLPDRPKLPVVRGPNIKPFPPSKPVAGNIFGKVLLKMHDNITTDHIMPSNASLLPYRSNIPHLSKYCFAPIDEEFSSRATEYHGGFLVAGENYGQGSSREHAALVPLYLGVRAVLAKSFARIHLANLLNTGILPLTFKNPEDYESISLLDELVIQNTDQQLIAGDEITVLNKTKGASIICCITASPRMKEILLSGGTLLWVKKHLASEVKK
ncbi:MAG: aconitate hydratase [Christensenellales bacterium]|jgi:aconitate hydratase